MTDKELADIEAIFKMASSKSFENDVTEARRIVLNSPRIPALLAHTRELRAANKPQWISVNDRLPENNQEIDVWIKTADSCSYRECNLVFNRDDMVFNGEDDYDACDDEFADKIVTHWMPLLEQPREREDGNG